MPLPAQDRGSRALSASLTWAACLGLFAWGGFWLDGKVGTKPLFMLVGCALGGIGGFIHFLATLAPEVLPWKKRQDGAGDVRPKKLEKPEKLEKPKSSETQDPRNLRDGRSQPEEP